MDRLKAELDHVLGFWLEYSIDEEFGGFFDSLDEDGKVFDETKHVWLQGRQCWMLARFAGELTDEEFACARMEATRRGWEKAEAYLCRSELIRLATRGVDFLKENAIDGESGLVYFALRRDGTPCGVQRKPFSGAFLGMAMAEVGAVNSDRCELLDESVAMLDKVSEWMEDPTLLGRPVVEGAYAFSPLNAPMIRLNMYSEIRRALERGRGKEAAEEFQERMKDKANRCVDAILEHVVSIDPSQKIRSTPPAWTTTNKKTILENVPPLLSIPDGRLTNPGHAIEAGWFLLDHAIETSNSKLAEQALEIVQVSMEAGWDEEHGGLYYFLDALGFPPTQLEWNMKLWWPHCEAMIACSKALAYTKDPKWEEQLQKVISYSLSTFSDPSNGEWYGYCTVDSKPSHTCKGAAYKGFFHVPRALLYTLRASAKK